MPGTLPTTPIEVIVVDDASPEDMRSALASVEGLRVVRNDRNEGFIGSCNRGARVARGRFLFFLNNDTEVLPGWCDELVETFGAVPQAGIVGSKLLYPDGRLQEAGGIIWRDGSGWNVGKFDDPAKPEYSYRREVDYVSGAALLVPTGLFWELGGFDAHYAPAYGEDSDLAFKVRDAGRSVLFQPLSRVVHHEGVTSGTDLASGVKAHQVENGRKLYARWRERLASHQEPGQQVTRAMERGVSLRVLVLDLCTPEPDKDAGSITAFNIMRILQQLGCKVTFAPVDNYLFLDRYTTDLQRLGIECLYAPFVTSVEEYLRQRGDAFDLVLIFRFVAARRHLADLRRLAPRARVVLHASDLHFLREQREADVRNDSRMRQRADRIKREELAIIQQVDCTIVHSTFEQALLAEEAAARARRGLRVGDRRAGDDGAVRVPARRRLHRRLPASAKRRWRAVLRSRDSAAGAASSCPTYGSTSWAAIRPPSFSRCKASRSWSPVSCPILVRCWMACASASRRCAMAPGSRARSAPV